MSLTQDKWVRKIVTEGYQPRFSSSPPLRTTPPMWIQSTQSPQLDAEVRALWMKGAIAVVDDPSTPGFYCSVFTVPKKTGDFRLIINLRPLNKHLVVDKFQMDSLKHVRQALGRHDWTVSVDLKDAYLHIPIHPEFQRYLRFVHQDVVYAFQALPFGLATAPCVFTCMMRPILAWCHIRNIHLHAYIDDWLLRNQSHNDLIHHRQVLLSMLHDLGLEVNFPKSRLTPSQSFQFLGAWLDLRDFVIRPSEERVLALGLCFHNLMAAPTLTARMTSQLIGIMDSLADLVPMGRWRVRVLHWFRALQWRPRLSYDDVLPPLPITDPDLQWWMSPDNLLAGVPVQEPLPDAMIFTDASSTGWGAQCNDLTAAGTWTPDLQDLHINVLELIAVHRAIQAFQEVLRGMTVQIHSDNTTVVAYLMKGGGTHSASLHQVASNIFSLAISLGIRLQALHVPGKLNMAADALSRQRKVPATEWTLKQTICDTIFLRWGKPQVDLFATRHNRRLPAFVSPLYDELAWSTDALTFDWNALHGYAFPPFSILPKVLQKIQTSAGSFVVIAPNWPTQTWFPLLLQLCVEPPFRLPLVPDLLSQRHGVHHSFLERLHLHAWKLSSNVQRLTFSGAGCQKTSCSHTHIVCSSLRVHVGLTAWLM